MISIKKLVLHNFMAVSDAELSFQDEGITLFVGENGYGKSTVADAITLCFLESKRSDACKDYVKQGTDEATIHLEGTLYGKPIVFDISISSPDGKMKKKLAYGDETFATNSEVSKKLEELDIAYFADILFTSQKADDITTLTPLKRAEYMKRLLDVSFEEELKHIEVDTDIDKESSQKKVIEREQKQRTLDNKDSEYQTLLPMPDPTAIQSLSNEITSITNDINMLTEQVSANSETLTKVSELKDTVSQYDNEISKVKGNINNRKDIIHRAEFDMETQQKSLADSSLIEAKCTTLFNEMEELRVKETPLYEDMQTKKATMDSKKQVEQESFAAMQNAKRLFTEKKNAESTGICPTCKRPYDNFDLEKAKAETEEAKVACDTTEVTYQKAKADLDLSTEDYNKAVASYNEINVTKILKTEEYKKQKASLDSCPREKEVNALIDKLKEDIRQSQVLIDSFEVRIKELEESKVMTNADIDNLNKSIIPVDNTLLRQKNILRMNKQSELDELNKVSATNAQIEIQNSRVTESKKALEKELKVLDSEIADVANHMAMLKEARQMLEKDLPNFLIVRTCAKLQETINQQLQASFPYLEVYLFQSKKGVEFFYTTNAELSNPDDKNTLINAKMLSGCQKDFVTIAFKLALAKAYKLPFAFFDEIDSAATEHNSESMYSSLLNSGILKQIFLITHNAETRNIIANLGYDVTCYRLPEKGVFQLTEDLGDVN